jgi:hypothetical protein
MRRRFERIQDVVDPLEMLVTTGWLRAESGLPVKVGQRGTPSPTFYVHPDAADHLANGAKPVDDGSDAPEFRAHSRFAEKGVYQDLPTYTSLLSPPLVQSANGAKPSDGGPPHHPTTTRGDTTEDTWTLI